jgi:hypothetical protein
LTLGFLILTRTHTYRDERGRAQKRNLANLSKLPSDMVAALKAFLKGATVIPHKRDGERTQARHRGRHDLANVLIGTHSSSPH